MDPHSLQSQMIENRKLLSSFFITVLIGHAYAELVPQIQSLLRLGDMSFPNLALMGTFFCISMRFFIGNQLHLLDKSVNSLPGTMWLYDLLAITMQSIILIALAGTCNVDTSKHSDFGFMEVTVALYVMDIMWISSLWLLGKIRVQWKRVVVPWGWAILNTFLIIFTLLLSWCMDDPYSVLGLSLVLGVNVIAFLIDVVLIDYHKALVVDTPEEIHA